jgi:hypothetical protein
MPALTRKRSFGAGGAMSEMGQGTNPLPRERAAREAEGWASTRHQLSSV